jgi:hypothetical protein
LQVHENLVRLQAEMNGRVQTLTVERDAAESQKDDVSRVMNETRASIPTQTQESVWLAR